MTVTTEVAISKLLEAASVYGAILARPELKIFLADVGSACESSCLSTLDTSRP